MLGLGLSPAGLLRETGVLGALEGHGNGPHQRLMVVVWGRCGGFDPRFLRGKGAGHLWSPAPALKRSLGGRGLLFWGSPGRHMCCPFAPGLLLPRYIPEDAGQEAPGIVFLADGNRSGATGAADSSFKGSPRWLGPCAWRGPGENLYDTSHEDFLPLRETRTTEPLFLSQGSFRWEMCGRHPPFTGFV